MIKWETKGEVTPEELRRHFEEEKRRPGNPFVLYQGFFDYITPYVVKAILMTNIDPMTKAKAIYYFGRLAGAAVAVASIYWFASSFEEDVCKEVAEEVERDLQDAVEVAIKIYSYIKEGKLGKPLDIALSDLIGDAYVLERDAARFFVAKAGACFRS